MVKLRVGREKLTGGVEAPWENEEGRVTGLNSVLHHYELDALEQIRDVLVCAGF